MVKIGYRLSLTFLVKIGADENGLILGKNARL